MPQTPDFDAIAKRLARSVPGDLPAGAVDILTADITAQLRQLWNARGAADIDALETAYDAESPSMKRLDRAIRALDR